LFNRNAEADCVSEPTPRPIAAMLAPYSSVFFKQQTDFGHSAGAVLLTIDSDLSKICVVARLAAAVSASRTRLLRHMD